MQYYIKFINLFSANFEMSIFFSWLYEKKSMPSDIRKHMFKIIGSKGSKNQNEIFTYYHLFTKGKMDIHFLLFDQLTELRIGITANNNQEKIIKSTYLKNCF